MNYQFLCPKCSQLLDAEGEWDGGAVFCPECGEAMGVLDGSSQVPLPSDLEAVSLAEPADVSDLANGSLAAGKRQRAAAVSLGLPLEVRSKATDIFFRLIPAGEFSMGSPRDELGRDPNESLIRVRLTRPFYCGKYEVTQGQWLAIMGSNPSDFQSEKLDHPVECVTWDDCQEFCERLCHLEGVPSGTYRLLSEAEWEYACRAGTQTALYNGELTTVNKHCTRLEEIAWYDMNSDRHTHPVGQKKPNAWGLHDCLGNVYEWCLDTWCESLPPEATDPRQTTPEYACHRDDRVYRGGSWFYGAKRCRAANRFFYNRTEGYDNLGFRIMRELPLP